MYCIDVFINFPKHYEDDDNDLQDSPTTAQQKIRNDFVGGMNKEGSRNESMVQCVKICLYLMRKIGRNIGFVFFMLLIHCISHATIYSSYSTKSEEFYIERKSNVLEKI